jgi:predicted HAD superfamily hydrolase/2-polyprenyl-3-methyl-5-hydroxy-6-metoxy-1,4-benzoquinol methylase
MLWKGWRDCDMQNSITMTGCDAKAPIEGDEDLHEIRRQLPQYYQQVRPDILRAVPADSLRVLDVGCGAGVLGKAIKARNRFAHVVGIELNKPAAKVASHELDEIYQVDIERFAPPFVEGQFDCLIFADILEHLRDPWKLVKGYVKFLRPGGALVVSVPNVRRLSILHSLIEHGTWEYTEEGILDRTHLRFFTRSSFMSLLADASIGDICCEHLGMGELVSYNPVGGVITICNLTIKGVSAENYKDLCALQFLFVGKYLPGQTHGDREAAKPQVNPLDSRSIYTGPLVALQHFFGDGLNYTDTTPVVIKEPNAPETLELAFDLSQQVDLGALRIDLNISIAVVKIHHILLERRSLPTLDLTRCMVTNGTSFGDLIYWFEGNTPPQIGFSPLPAQELKGTILLKVKLTYTRFGPQAITECIQQMRRLQSSYENSVQAACAAQTPASVASSESDRLTDNVKTPPPPAMKRVVLSSTRQIDILHVQKRSPGRIAVHLHLFYIDMAESLLCHFAKMPFAFDLFITVVDAQQVASVELLARRLCGPMLGNLHVMVVPNRGRDIGAFLTALQPFYNQYDYICHVHSKKSLYSGTERKDWCDYLFASLFKDEEHLRRIFGLFTAEPKIGLVYPSTYQEMPYWCHSWLSNHGSAHDLFNRLKINVDIEPYIDYPVGSMVWARTQALKPLFDLNLRSDDFPLEPIPNDGTLCHAIERCLCIAGYLQGFTFAEVDIRSSDFTVGEGKKNLWQYWDRSMDHLWNVLQPFEKISFDIFDTVVARPLLAPDHVFLLVQQAIASDLNISIDFLCLRKQAEAIARQRLKPGEDATLASIYECLAAVSGLTGATVERIRQIEVATELRLTLPRKGMPGLIARLQAHGKQIFFVSDMYLPSDILRRILEKHGIDMSCATIQVSSETGLRKDSGAIWRIFRQRIAHAHVGDNEHSDVQLAVDSGVPTYHVMSASRLCELVQPKTRIIHRSTLGDSMYAGPVTARLFSSPFALHGRHGKMHISDPKELGYCIFGPVLLHFTKWLYQRSRELGIRHLLFLAREGYLLLQLFELFTARYGDNGARCSYLLCSRRANSVPMIRQDADLRTILEEQYTGSLANLLENRFGLDPDKLAAEGTLSQERLYHQATRLPHEFDRVYRDVLKFKKAIFANAKNERKSYRSYLKQMGLSPALKTAVVDIGFAGTIQKHLQKLTAIDLQGFYFVTNQKARRNPVADAMHACFGSFAGYQQGNCIYDYSLLLESVLTAPAGQFVRFETDGRPVYGKNANTEASWPIIRAVQLGIIDYFRDGFDWFGEALMTHEPHIETVVHFFRLMAEHPDIISPSLRNSLKVDDFYVSNGVVQAFQYAGRVEAASAVTPADVAFATSYQAERASSDHARFRSLHEFNAYFEDRRYDYEERLLIEKILSNRSIHSGRLDSSGQCDCCGKETRMRSDWSFSDATLSHKAYLFDASKYADWYGKVLLFREHFVCAECKLNNRQRGVFHALAALGMHLPALEVYAYEQVTPFYAQVQKKARRSVGSEYLGIKRQGGKVYGGVRHEDALHLSFADVSFDLLVSNDVFEHVPDIEQALREALRVLKPGGTLLYSVPFDLSAARTVRRACWQNGRIEHMLPPVYHGNPVADQGSLVFYDFGWDIIDTCARCGFSDAFMLYYYSMRHALVGGGLQFIFAGVK